MAAQELQAAGQGEADPAPPAARQALDGEEHPRHQRVRVAHGKEEEAGDHPRQGEDQGGEQRGRAPEAQLAGQQPGAAAADHEAQPRQEHEAELQRQGGEEQVQGEERRPRAVAPVGAAGELVRVPERQPAGAQLVAEEEEPGLDLPGDVPQVGVARRRLGDPLPGGLFRQRRRRAGDAVRQPQRRPQQRDARQTAGRQGNAEANADASAEAGLAPPPDEAGEGQEGEQGERGVHASASQG